MSPVTLAVALLALIAVLLCVPAAERIDHVVRFAVYAALFAIGGTPLLIAGIVARCLWSLGRTCVDAYRESAPERAIRREQRAAERERGRTRPLTPEEQEAFRRGGGVIALLIGACVLIGAVAGISLLFG